MSGCRSSSVCESSGSVAASKTSKSLSRPSRCLTPARKIGPESATTMLVRLIEPAAPLRPCPRQPQTSMPLLSLLVFRRQSRWCFPSGKEPSIGLPAYLMMVISVGKMTLNQSMEAFNPVSEPADVVLSCRVASRAGCRYHFQFVVRGRFLRLIGGVGLLASACVLVSRRRPPPPGRRRTAASTTSTRSRSRRPAVRSTAARRAGPAPVARRLPGRPGASSSPRT